jgi:peptide/nickel transport system ATP-binding protein
MSNSTLIKRYGVRFGKAKYKHPYTQALLNSILTPDPALGLLNAHLGAQYRNPINPLGGCTFHPRCVKKLDKCEHIRPTPVLTGSGVVVYHLHE